MRSRRLLFGFASILSGAVTPAYAAWPRAMSAGGQETLEIADINLPIPELRRLCQLPILRRDYLIRTITFGRPAAKARRRCACDLNRKLSEDGYNIKDVVTILGNSGG
jgi:hypothetical protein